MATNGNHAPKPEPVWIALAFVIWATAAALGPQRRERFIKTLSDLAESEEARRRVISINATNGRRRQFTQSVQAAVRFTQRIVAELRAASR